MKFKLPSIPKDDDAKGIVVRVLSFEYYLKPFWLTFKDLYIEVEFQICTRRMRLKQSIYYSLVMIFMGFYILMAPIINEKVPMIPNIIYDNAPIKFKLLYFITGISLVITSLIQIIISYIKSINNIFNWPIINIIKTSIIMNIYFFTIMDSYSHIKYDEKLTKQGNDFREYIYMFETGMNQTLSLFMSFIFILTIISIHIVNIKQYLIFIFIHTSFILVCTIRYYNLSLSNNNFQEIYYDIGWRISGLLIPGIWNNNDNTNQASMERNAKMMLSKKEIEESIWCYEDSIFNINKYFWNTMKVYIFLWIILILFLFYVVYTREKGLRADFILRRVHRLTDEPRNLESGIKIQSLININETKEEQEIIQENLEKWKKYSSSNSSNNPNFVIEVNFEEKESTVDNLALMELGDALDDKTVKSFNSDNSFKRDKNDIIESIQNIAPKLYTKSEINYSINDTESESHVQC